MRQSRSSRRRSGSRPRLYTLTEVARKIGVSIPTAQRYKKIHQERLPSVGVGRSQRYPREALEIFQQIKEENLQRRGRPATGGRGGKSVARKGPRPRRKASERRTTARKIAAPGGGAHPGGPGLLTLTEISRRTGISYPTCIDYVKKHLDRIPHVGKGRQRRFPPEAVAAFRRLRSASRRRRRTGRSPGPSRTEKALLRRMRELEKSQRQLTKSLDAISKALKAPLQITVKRRQ